MPDAVAQIKDTARKTWAAGDFDHVWEVGGLASMGENLVAHADIGAGYRVCSTWARAAATPRCPRRGPARRWWPATSRRSCSRRAARAPSAEGLDIEWVEADAEALPFEDGSFDRVMSAIGAMFAPRHDVTAAELARVCAPGGMVAMANWAPEGGIGEFFATLGKHMPPPPPGLRPPVLWGSEDHVRELFEPHGLELEFDRGEVGFKFESVPGPTWR